MKNNDFREVLSEAITSLTTNTLRTGLAMLGIVIPNLPADALSGNALISITDVPEIINRYEYSYHPKKRS